MRLIITLFLLSLVCNGCRNEPTTPGTDTTSQTREAQTSELRHKLRAVTTADGISKSEAELIAECYFHQNVGCGAFTGIQDGGDFWIVDAKVGFAGTPVKDFHIDKRTGRITSPIGPSYATPLQIFP